ncbi:MAG: 50S ribosomal protein L4 [Sulfolobales archaeon]|nr:50S ribosomal protein L4 [Sulfolobales archaeon]MDW8083208.1 50S ribosomal protein L4 [Sulfolobales archaeon]
MRVLILSEKIQQKKVPLYGLDGKLVSEVTLPPVFSIAVRKDLIRRAFLSALTARLQPKGRDELAGRRRVGESWGINYSVARVPRLDNGRAVLAPNVRGGRLAFPPTIERKIHERVNKKERSLALASALAATAEVELVRRRGHKFSTGDLPIVVVDDFELFDKTSSLRRVLQTLGVWEDVVRAQGGTKIRAGKGKMRGRRYEEPKSLLIVVSSSDRPIVRAARALPGVEVVSVDLLSVLHLAPGGHPGRLMVVSASALDKIGKKFEVVAP